MSNLFLLPWLSQCLLMWFQKASSEFLHLTDHLSWQRRVRNVVIELGTESPRIKLEFSRTQ